MWSLVETAEAWAKYKADTSEKLGVAVSAVVWGEPKEFPCLACSVLPPWTPGNPPKMYSAYVYPGDAEELLRVAGKRVTAIDAPPPAGQQQFNRWHTAGLLTVVNFMERTGICKPEQYEETLLEMLEMVDAYVGDKREELRKTLSPHAVALLDAGNPPKT